MMKGSRAKKIVFIFSSGSLLSIKNNKSIFFVDQENDIKEWLSEVPELSLLANINAEFIQGEHEPFNNSSIEKIVTELHTNRNLYDGFVVLVRGEHMIEAAAAAEFMLRGFGKPIIFTGSRYSPDAINQQDLRSIIKRGGLGLRSNVINALQAATSSDFARTAIMFGNKLIKPTKALINDFYALNLFKSVDEKYLGKIDFGVTLNKEPKTAEQNYEPVVSLSHEVVIAESDAVYEPSFYLTQFGKADTILIHARENEILDEASREKLTKLFPTVLFFNQHYVIDQPGIVPLSRMTWPAAKMKVLWARSVTKSRSELLQLLQQDCVNEFNDRP